MYRLMQSEKFTLKHPVLGQVSTYRQRLVGHFREIRVALEACHKANAEGRQRFYVLNEAGQENYHGYWIQ
jgi:hypothetical protein